MSFTLKICFVRLLIIDIKIMYHFGLLISKNIIKISSTPSNLIRFEIVVISNIIDKY